jgi:hypothetical protein
MGKSKGADKGGGKEDKSKKGSGKGSKGDSNDGGDAKSTKVKGAQSINVRHILVRFVQTYSHTHSTVHAHLRSFSVRSSPRARKPWRG